MSNSAEGAECGWQQDDDGIFDTECGEKFWFDSGTVAENGFAFCPYCGKGIIELTRQPVG